MRLARGTPIWLNLLPLISIAAALIHIFLVRSFILLITAAVILLVCSILMLFFRDPERNIAGGVVSPADGRVLSVESRGRNRFVSIFMNIHDVHVNRCPWDAEVLGIRHVPGGYMPAFNKGSENNERVILELKAGAGRWTMKQIAGAVARRIIPYVEEGDRLRKGDRVGLIRFGSRVDLEFVLPAGMEICVSPGDKVKAGSSSLARPKRRDLFERRYVHGRR
ncbi:MAG: phosphatidylserine decarboxylase [Thermoplasmatota archaeon]